MPILAVSLYLLLRKHQGVDYLNQLLSKQGISWSGRQLSEDAAHPDQEISSMVDNLVARLEKQPDDLEGWNHVRAHILLLWVVLKKQVIVYAKLLARSPDSPEALVNYADVLCNDTRWKPSGETLLS